MAGTATSYNASKIAQSAGSLWANVAIPAAGASLTLFTDGTPDATANPSAKHLGYTKAGAVGSVKPKFAEYFADEDPSPIKRAVDTLEMSISGELLQITDTDLLQLLTPGVGTKSTGTGYEIVNFGIAPIVFTSVALIFPSNDSPAKWCVFHLYKASNDGGVDFKIGRKELSSAPFSFKGVAVPGRATTDLYGQFLRNV